MSVDILPFTLQLPSGYSLAAGSSSTPAKTASSVATPASTTSSDAGSTPVDVVSISNAFDAGTFTAHAGDVFSLSALFNGQAGTSSAVVGYRVGLGDGSGTLLLSGKPFAGQAQLSGSFTADEFSRLTYTAGADGSQQSLVIVAQTGTRRTDGTLSQEVDSPAVQITAEVTGSRSINAMNALRTQLQPDDADAGIASIAQQAGIFTGFVGTTRSALTTDGNFAAKAGDIYRMGDLFKATAPTGHTIAGFRVALGGVASGDGGGKLQLNGVDVADGTTSFSAEDFARLTYLTGTGGPQNLVVIAQAGTRLAAPAGSPPGTLGALSREIDSPAVQITANVTTGSRSINAMNALSNPKADDADADTVSIAQQAGIFTGFVGSTRPTLQTGGNFTAKAGDIFRMSDLFKASAPSGQTLAGFRVALGGVASADGAGKLYLGTLDVSSRTSFSAEDFAHLTYVTGTGGPQSLVVIAQTGTMHTDGTLSREIDSPAVQITANATGTRSINAMNALSTVPSGADANIASIVQQAGIFTGFVGSTRPTLQTVGNFSAAANVYQMGDLFTASAATGQAIVGYQVTLGDGGGKLQLNGQDVTGQPSFTADEFAHLAYIAGTAADGSQLHQSLTVAAQTTPIAQEIGFDAAGDTYRMGDLFTATPPADQTITGYQVNLGVGGGKLQVSGQDVPGQTDFTADEFAHLAYIAGPGAEGQQLPQSLTVMAQTASLLTDGTISQDIGFDAHVTDDPYPMANLFTTNVPAGEAIVGYRVTLGDGAGKLQVSGQDVPGQTSFTADEFARLTYSAGTDGARSLSVEAQTTPLPTPPITQAIDFNATGNTYGMGDLFTASAPTGEQIVEYQLTLGGGGGKLQVSGQDVSGQTGFTADEYAHLTYIAGPGANGSPLPQSLTAAAQPAITQTIDFTPVADVYRMDGLFHASAPTGQTIVGYRVALGEGGGILMKGTDDVTDQTSFTADEFAHLTYIARAGADASQPGQSLVVVAQTGKLRTDGTISQEIDSPAVQITANIIGTRSINAMSALSTVPSEADAATVGIVQQAGIFTGFVGSTRPTLQTDGNFTAVAADTYRMSDLFKASAPTGQTIAGFRVALAGGGQLWRDGQNVTGTTSFTADQFAHLTFIAGAKDTQQSLVVVAQTGTRTANAADGTLGALSHEIDSAAVQITANVTGSRSINAMNALNTASSAADAAMVGIVQQAGIFTGFVGSTRPTLQTVLTPVPPISLTALEDATGSFRSAGMTPANPEFDLLSLYPGATGNSVSPGILATPGGPLAIAQQLLGGAATGAFQTAGNVTANAQAIKAYVTANGL